MYKNVEFEGRIYRVYIYRKSSFSEWNYTTHYSLILEIKEPRKFWFINYHTEVYCCTFLKPSGASPNWYKDLDLVELTKTVFEEYKQKRDRELHQNDKIKKFYKEWDGIIK